VLHPKVKQKYEQNNFPIDVEKASDQNEHNFLTQAKSDIKKTIVKIVRVKANGKEHFFYGEEWTSKNYLGNKIMHYNDPVGKYEDPNFRTVVDDKGNPTVAEVEGFDTVYEYSWPSDWTEEMEARLGENVDLIVKHINRKYGGFSFEDFKNKSFDDLVRFGIFGTYNPAEQKQLEKRKNSIAK